MERAMRVTRKRYLLSALAGAAAGPIVRFPAGAAEFSYKWGNGQTSTHPFMVAARAAVEKIKKESGGRLEITLYPQYQLGSDSSMLLQVRSGALEFESSAEGELAQLVPGAGISSVPFAFASYRQAWAAVDGSLGAYIANGARKAGFYVFPGTWDSGFRQLSNGIRPVATPEDLKGLKIRVPPAPVSVATFNALGATPTAVSANDLYTSLQTHLVDGVEVPMVAFDDFKLSALLKYMSIWNYEYGTSLTLGNADAIGRLPRNLRELVERTFHEYAVIERNAIQQLDVRLADKLKADGVTVTAVDSSVFKAATRSAGLYAKWRAQYGNEAWALLEQSVGRLT